jgi:tyrosine-protein phosphatase SIW14
VRIVDYRSWILGACLGVMMAVVPYLYYRYTLEHTKRLRPVVQGRIYRSGCLTADGFRDAIENHKIKTVITFWDENPDPALPGSHFNWTTIKESELCKKMGVQYRFIHVKCSPEELNWRVTPSAVKEFLDVMDREESYPVLFHCKAGLHRTGVMAAVYRMEYEGWTKEDALREVRAHGFGHFNSNKTNPYIQQFVLNYQPRPKSQTVRTVLAMPVSRTQP